jgi:DNA-binding NarL/FixJ family response regulator
MMDNIRVLIADDHPVFRFGLQALLMADPNSRILVVGEAATGEEAFDRAVSLSPDVILMDLNMPGGNGIEAMRRILRESPHIGILVLTMLEDAESVFAAVRAGARGYLLKGANGDETVQAIQTVAGGGILFSPSIAQHVLRYFATPRRVSTTSTIDAFPDLTDREREVLTLIAQGYTNTAIAERLYLSQKTVRNHVSNIFSKLQVADRAQAIIRAREAGLGNS